MRRRLAAAALVAAVCAVGPSADATADGPWKLEVVDAETGQPLHGVVVLLLWRTQWLISLHPSSEFHDVYETVTDTEGRVTIPDRKTSWNPLRQIRGPIIYVFKSGWGQWRFRSVAPMGTVPNDVRDKQVDDAWARFRGGQETVVALPRLKTREERERLTHPSTPLGEVPRDRIPRWLEEYNRDAISRGLAPLPIPETK
jgi:hypothetical protein